MSSIRKILIANRGEIAVSHLTRFPLRVRPAVPLLRVRVAATPARRGRSAGFWAKIAARAENPTAHSRPPAAPAGAGHFPVPPVPPEHSPETPRHRLN